MNALMRGFRESYLQTARDYAESGCLEEALAVLGECSDDYPMLTYYRACCLNRLGETEAAEEACRKADSCPPLYCFPKQAGGYRCAERCHGAVSGRGDGILLSW